jgi:hypothetical protein
MRKWFLPACVLIYGVLTALLIFAVPIGAAPDENAHLEYAQYLLDKKQFPVFAAKGANHPGYEFHQPPLYYGATAILWSISPPAARPYAARLLSMLCGALTLVLLWHALRLLFPNDEVLAALATGFVALWPLHINVGASAGNDAAAGLMCAGIFWAIARLATRAQTPEYSWRDAALVGVFFGLGLLSKSSCLTVGLAGLGALWHIMQRRAGVRAAMPSTLLALAVTILICGAWLLRNQTLYGDPLAAKIFDEAFKNSSPRPQAVMAATGVNVFGYLRAYFIVLFATCWGFFGGPNTAIGVLNPFGGRVRPDVAALQAQMLLPILPLMLACLAATVIGKLAFLKWLQERWRSLEPVQKIVLLWWGIGMTLVCLALLRFNLIQFQAQARYLHPALLPMAALFALGWQRFFYTPKRLQLFMVAFGLALLAITLWNIFAWKTLV